MNRAGLSFLLMALCSGTALGAPPRPSLLRVDGTELASALQRAAIRFHPPATMGLPATVTLVRRLERHDEGYELEQYAVARWGAPVGEFARVRVLEGFATQLDMALRLDGDRIVDAMALRQPVIDGRAVFEVERILAPFRNLSPTRFGPPMEALCRSLVYVERMGVARSDGGPEPTDEAGRALSQRLFDLLPKPGLILPSFDVTTLAGTRLTPACFGDRPLLFFFGTVGDDRSLAMQALVHRFWSNQQRAVSLVTVFIDSEAEVNAFVDGGGTLVGHTVVDFHEQTKLLFQIPTVPYLVCYDEKGALVAHTLHRSADETNRTLDDFLRTVVTR